MTPMTIVIGIYVKGMFLGTPEQFDDAYGGGIEWDTFGEDQFDLAMRVAEWSGQSVDDVLVCIGPSVARDVFFSISDEDRAALLKRWATVQYCIHNEGQYQSARRQSDMPDSIFGTIFSQINDLKWFQPDPENDPDLWYSVSDLDEFELVAGEDGLIHFWATGEGPVYKTMEQAKEGVNMYHKCMVMRNFFGGRK